jgi:DUF1680 family protein
MGRSIILPYKLLIQNYTHGDAVEKDGFLHYPTRKYTTQTISIYIPFPVTYIKPNPLVLQDKGRVAIRRGPLIFAMDSADNDFIFADAKVIPGAYLEESIQIGGFEVPRIYIPGQVNDQEKALKFIPYWSWGNRGYGDVLVWCETVHD